MKKETNKKKRTVSFIIQIILNLCFYGVVIFATMTIADKGYKFAYNMYGPVTIDKGEGKVKEFEVKKGASRYNIAEKLYKEKLIVDKYSFYCRFMLDRSNIQPDTYELYTSWTYEQIIAALSGKTKEEVEALVTKDNKGDNVIVGSGEDDSDLDLEDSEKEDKESDSKDSKKEDKESDSKDSKKEDKESDSKDSKKED